MVVTHPEEEKNEVDDESHEESNDLHLVEVARADALKHRMTSLCTIQGKIVNTNRNPTRERHHGDGWRVGRQSRFFLERRDTQFVFFITDCRNHSQAAATTRNIV